MATFWTKLMENRVSVSTSLPLVFFVNFFFRMALKILEPTKNARDPNLARHVGPRTQNEKFKRHPELK